MKSKEQDAQTKKSKSENAHEVGEMNKQSEEDAETAKEEEKRARVAPPARRTTHQVLSPRLKRLSRCSIKK